MTGPEISGGDPLTPSLVVSVVPEPGTLALTALGLLGLVGLARRGRHS